MLVTQVADHHSFEEKSRILKFPDSTAQGVSDNYHNKFYFQNPWQNLLQYKARLAYVACAYKSRKHLLFISNWWWQSNDCVNWYTIKIVNNATSDLWNDGITCDGLCLSKDQRKVKKYTTYDWLYTWKSNLIHSLAYENNRETVVIWCIVFYLSMKSYYCIILTWKLKQ